MADRPDCSDAFWSGHASTITGAGLVARRSGVAGIFQGAALIAVSGRAVAPEMDLCTGGARKWGPARSEGAMLLVTECLQVCPWPVQSNRASWQAAHRARARRTHHCRNLDRKDHLRSPFAIR